MPRTEFYVQQTILRLNYRNLYKDSALLTHTLLFCLLGPDYFFYLPQKILTITESSYCELHQIVPVTRLSAIGRSGIRQGTGASCKF